MQLQCMFTNNHKFTMNVTATDKHYKHLANDTFNKRVNRCSHTFGVCRDTQVQWLVESWGWWETNMSRSSVGSENTTMDALLWTEDKDCRYLRWRATGESPDAASFKARDAFTSPSATIISQTQRETSRKSSKSSLIFRIRISFCYTISKLRRVFPHKEEKEKGSEQQEWMLTAEGNL